jgi:hypothetical protein
MFLLYFVVVADQKCSPNNDVSSANRKGANDETLLEYEMTDTDNGDCTTSNITRDDSWSRRIRRVRSTSGQRSRKRWRGRVDDLDYACGTLLDMNKDNATLPSVDMDEDTITEKQVDFILNTFSCPKIKIVRKKIVLSCILPQEFEANSSESRNTEDQKYEIILEMRELTQKGMASKVVEEINSIDPDFFPQNPFLLFQLKQVRSYIAMSTSEVLDNRNYFFFHESIK